MYCVFIHSPLVTKYFVFAVTTTYYVLRITVYSIYLIHFIFHTGFTTVCVCTFSLLDSRRLKKTSLELGPSFYVLLVHIRYGLNSHNSTIIVTPIVVTTCTWHCNCCTHWVHCNCITNNFSSAIVG